MKILALQGSPRPQGNTQAVLEVILSAAEQTGAETETVQLSDLKHLTGCWECFKCKQAVDLPGCALDDDMQQVLEKALRSDVLVFATPVFCWSPSWLMKTAMDRFYCMFKFTDLGNVTSLLKGRKMAAVITAGGGEDDGADLVTETCRRMADFMQVDWLGALVAGTVESPEAIRADAGLIERAGAFGRKLSS
jgi:multimeric flavodoxin WrbA